MGDRGAWKDNVFAERLWRSIKYAEIYPGAYAGVPEARAGTGPVSFVLQCQETRLIA